MDESMSQLLSVASDTRTICAAWRMVRTLMSHAESPYRPEQVLDGDRLLASGRLFPVVKKILAGHTGFGAATLTFVPKSSGRLRPYYLLSIQDHVALAAWLLVVGPLFESPHIPDNGPIVRPLFPPWNMGSRLDARLVPVLKGQPELSALSPTPIAGWWRRLTYWYEQPRPWPYERYQTAFKRFGRAGRLIAAKMLQSASGTKSFMAEEDLRTEYIERNRDEWDRLPYLDTVWKTERDAVYYGILDFKQFFPSIKRDVVCASFDSVAAGLVRRGLITEEDAAFAVNVLGRFMSLGVSIPQDMQEIVSCETALHHGSPSSSPMSFDSTELVKAPGILTGTLPSYFLSNVAMLPLDGWVSSHVCSPKGPWHGQIAILRYVDDHVVLATSQQCLLEFLRSYGEQAEELVGVHFNTAKLSPSGLSQLYLGQGDGHSEIDLLKEGQVVTATSYSTLLTQAIKDASRIAGTNTDLLSDDGIEARLVELAAFEQSHWQDQAMRSDTQTAFKLAQMAFRTPVPGLWVPLTLIRRIEGIRKKVSDLDGPSGAARAAVVRRLKEFIANLTLYKMDLPPWTQLLVSDLRTPGAEEVLSLLGRARKFLTGLRQAQTTVAEIISKEFQDGFRNHPHKHKLVAWWVAYLLRPDVLDLLGLEGGKSLWRFLHQSVLLPSSSAVEEQLAGYELPSAVVACRNRFLQARLTDTFVDAVETSLDRLRQAGEDNEDYADVLAEASNMATNDDAGEILHALDESLSSRLEPLSDAMWGLGKYWPETTVSCSLQKLPRLRRPEKVLDLGASLVFDSHVPSVRVAERLNKHLGGRRPQVGREKEEGLWQVLQNSVQGGVVVRNALASEEAVLSVARQFADGLSDHLREGLLRECPLWVFSVHKTDALRLVPLAPVRDHPGYIDGISPVGAVGILIHTLVTGESLAWELARNSGDVEVTAWLARRQVRTLAAVSTDIALLADICLRELDSTRFLHFQSYRGALQITRFERQSGHEPPSSIQDVVQMLLAAIERRRLMRRTLLADGTNLLFADPHRGISNHAVRENE